MNTKAIVAVVVLACVVAGAGCYCSRGGSGRVGIQKPDAGKDYDGDDDDY